MTDEPINLNVDITTLTPAQKAALHRRVRKLRLDTQNWLKPVETLEKNLKEALIAEVPKSGDGVVYRDVDGSSRVLTITSKDEPIIDDWQKLIEALKAADRFDLLQKRLATGAVKDIENWREIPGIAELKVLDISDTKV